MGRAFGCIGTSSANTMTRPWGRVPGSTGDPSLRRAHLGTDSLNTEIRWLDTCWIAVCAQLRQRHVEAATPAEPEPVASLAQRLRQAAM